MPSPTPGRIVLVQCGPLLAQSTNGDPVVPAIVTASGESTVGVKVFLNAYGEEWLPEVPFFETREEAGDAEQYAYWPPRDA